MAPPAAAVVNAALPGLSTVHCHFVTDFVYWFAELNKSKSAEDSDVVWSAWIGLPATVPGMLPGMFPFAAAQASI